MSSSSFSRGTMDSPTSPLQQQSNPSADREHRHNSASRINKQAFSSPRTSGTHTAPPSAAQMKARRSSPTSSSSLSSSSSSDSLAPTSIDFKRSGRHRQRHRSPARFPLLHRPRTFGERVDDSEASLTQILPSTVEALKICPQQMPSLGRSAHPPPSITSQEGSSINIAQRWDTESMHCEDISKHVDVDKEDNRKQIMWRAACAMVHAYLHQHDVHRHGLHQHELHRHGLRKPVPQRHTGTVDKNGPHLWEDVCDIQEDVRHVHTSRRTADTPPFPSLASIKRDQMYPSSMCFSDDVDVDVDGDGDVVCIDEVVNPTQAAEWFGTLFLSTSALVS